MTPKDIALCSVFAVALPLGQMLFKWGAVYNERLTGPFLARVIVNRVWADLMGRGLVDPVDDLGELTESPR